MNADSTTEAAVRAVLDRLADVYVTRDVAVLGALFAPDPDVVMFSPGAERIVGPAAIQAKAESDWSRSESASLTYDRTAISSVVSVAWAVIDATFTVTAGGHESATPVHITFVLEERGEQWLIMHAHYSVAPAASGA